MTTGDVVMGRVVASYGVHGWLKVLPYTAEKNTLLKYVQWSLLDSQGVAREYRLKEGRMHGEHLLAALEGVTVREEAAALRGQWIAVPRDTLPKLEHGEVYFADLIGLTVINREKETLGTVTAVQEYGAQPVLHVLPPTEMQEDGKKAAEILIPFVDAHIDAVELSVRQIKVDWWCA